MKASSNLGWRQQSQLIDERNPKRSLLENPRRAATRGGDYEPHVITDDEVAIQADAIEARLTPVYGARSSVAWQIDTGLRIGPCEPAASPSAEARPAAATTSLRTKGGAG